MTMRLKMDRWNRVFLPRDLRAAAGLVRAQKLQASATPGRIVLEVIPVARGEVVKRGALKVWTGKVPSTPVGEAVDAMRHGER